MTQSTPAPRPGLRWWPAVGILVLAVLAVVWIRAQGDATFQERNLRTVGAGLITFALLLIWWMGFSRARWLVRWAGLGAVLVCLGVMALSLRIRGVTGDLVPIFERRWARRSQGPPPSPAQAFNPAPTVTASTRMDQAVRPDYPQYLGPARTGVLEGPTLDADWQRRPPEVLWRQPVGAAWSGFVIVGGRALTQEQKGEEEHVSCYDLETGRLLWAQGDPAHYATTIAGEGPRCTPTVAGGRVFTLGATGILNCLELETGRRVWQRVITADAGSGVPSWGFSGSPLVLGEWVIASAGGKPDKSLLAYRVDTGEIAWTAGRSSTGYGSPSVATLAGQPQILLFNSKRITSHDAANGTVLWEYPWGIGQPHVANPVVISSNRVLFSSGYGVGSELLEVSRTAEGSLRAEPVWKSKRMKAKFSNLVVRDDFLYGLDDGMFACVDLRDGSLRWKEGRYGHGQGLLVGELFLLMAEQGELVLLQLSPEAHREVSRFRVFNAKTWNPIALAGDRLLVRNDQEAACLRLPQVLDPSTGQPRRQ